MCIMALKHRKVFFSSPYQVLPSAVYQFELACLSA